MMADGSRGNAEQELVSAGLTGGSQAGANQGHELESAERRDTRKRVFTEAGQNYQTELLRGLLKKSERRLRKHISKVSTGISSDICPTDAQLLELEKMLHEVVEGVARVKELEGEKEDLLTLVDELDEEVYRTKQKANEIKNRPGSDIHESVSQLGAHGVNAKRSELGASHKANQASLLKTQELDAPLVSFSGLAFTPYAHNWEND